MEHKDCQIPERRKKLGCLAMPKDQIELKLSTILEKITDVSTDVKEVKSTIQEHSIKVVAIEKDIERIDKELTGVNAAHEKDIKIVHESIRRRDKKQMWLTTLIVGIGGFLATVANMLFGK